MIGARVGLACGAFAAVACLAATPAAKRTTQHVSIENVQFNPAQLTVHPGDRIVFTNKDFFPHTVTADDGTFDSKDIPANASWSYRVGKQGTYSYHCTLHPTMKGAITVR